MSKQINEKSMLPVGTVLSGRYRIDRYLSSGGFGNTYVATNIKFGNVVAIKEFFINKVSHREHDRVTVSVSNPGNGELFDQQLKKFNTEAKRQQAIRNPHIVAVHDLFDENGTAYYVMDYIDGESLSERMKRTRKPIPESEVRQYLPQILDALKTVHMAGFFHLDLKPGNMMVDKSGRIRLIDFGASKQEDKSGGAKASSLVCFTEGYAPVEQCEQNMKKFGPWTDIYALGATLYALLTNTHPPKPTDIDDDRTPDKHQALPFPSSVSEEVRELILWMMSYRRNDRPQSVQEIIEKTPFLGQDEDVLVSNYNGATQFLGSQGNTNSATTEPISESGSGNRPPKPDNNLLWPILSTFFCCPPFGLLSIFNAFKVDSFYQHGDYEAAEEASENAKKYTKWSAIAGGVLLLIFILFGVIDQCSSSPVPAEVIEEAAYDDVVLNAEDTVMALQSLGVATVEEAEYYAFQETLDSILAAKMVAAEAVEEAAEYVEAAFDESDDARRLVELDVKNSNKDCPFQVDDGVMITNISLSGNYIVYRVECDEDEMSISDLNTNKKTLKNEMMNGLFTDTEEEREFKEHLKTAGIGLIYKYVGKTSGNVCTVKIESTEL